MALLPAGALRRKAEQRLREVLGVVPKGTVPPAGKGPGPGGKPRGVITGEAPQEAPKASEAQEAMAQAERRALRLFLCCTSFCEVLSVLVLTDPLHREAMGWLWCLTKRLGGVVRPPAEGPLGASAAPEPVDGLREVALPALPHMDPPLAALLAPLLHCGEAVRTRLTAHPEGELMCILAVLELAG